MRELHVAAVSEDGRHVLLATRKGASRGEFRVALDDRLAAALRGELPRPGERTAPDVVLSPKDIQARLRAGESTEQIAASAGVPVARVERYAGPVLSEREGVINAARRAVLARSRRGLSGLPLGEAVAQHLSEAAGYKPETTTWSARREQSGRWVVELAFVARAKTRTAAWRYDPGSRELTSLDAGSAVLGHVDKTSGQRAAANPRPAAPTPGPAARRPAARTTAGRTSAAGTSAVKAAAAKQAVAKASDGEAAVPKAPAARAASARTPAAQILTVKRAAASGRLVPGRTVSAPGARQGAVGAATHAPVKAGPNPGAAEAPSEGASPAPPGEADAAQPVSEGPSGPPTLRVVPPPVPAAPAAASHPAAAREQVATPETALPRGEPATAAPDRTDQVATSDQAEAPDRSAAEGRTEDPGPTPAAAPAPAPRPARRAAGSRASVPAWADVLLGIAPVEPSRDRDKAQD